MRQIMTKVGGASLALLMTSFLATANAAEKAKLRLEIGGLAEAEGKVYYSVYDSEDTWLGDESVAGAAVDIVEAMQGDVVVAVVELPPGEYAVSIFYDVNANGELDTNFIGIPKEPVALSNNAKAKFGPPKCKDARFTLSSEGVVQSIEITGI